MMGRWFEGIIPERYPQLAEESYEESADKNPIAGIPNRV